MAKAPRFTRRDFEFIADEIAPYLGWGTNVKDIAKVLKRTNPKFNEERFIERATDAWDKRYKEQMEKFDDTIPDRLS